MTRPITLDLEVGLTTGVTQFITVHEGRDTIDHTDGAYIVTTHPDPQTTETLILSPAAITYQRIIRRVPDED